MRHHDITTGDSLPVLVLFGNPDDLSGAGAVRHGCRQTDTGRKLGSPTSALWTFEYCPYPVRILFVCYPYAVRISVVVGKNLLPRESPSKKRYWAGARGVPATPAGLSHITQPPVSAASRAALGPSR